MYRRSFPWVMGLSLCLQGCLMGPNYTPPDTPVPSQWTPKAPPQALLDTETTVWWHYFADPTLNILITKALQNNTDRQLAAMRIVEARAYQRFSAAALYPQISVNMMESHGNNNSLSSHALVSLFQTALDASFELDLFGANRRALEASTATLESTEAAYEDVTLTLIGDVVNTYTRWRALQQTKNLVNALANSQHETFNLYTALYEGGLSDASLALNASAAYHNTLTDGLAMDATLADTRSSLAILLGMLPSDLDPYIVTDGKLPQLDILPILEEPAKVLARRPDIRSAERALAAATALEGVAIAKTYPDISLSALLGIQHTTLLSKTYGVSSISGNITGPLLSFGRLEALIDVAHAQQQQALNQYQSIVMNAIGEVETRITEYHLAHARITQQKSGLSQKKQALSIAQAQYDQGLIAFTEVLTQQQMVYQAEWQLLEEQQKTTVAAIALCKSLGLGN